MEKGYPSAPLGGSGGYPPSQPPPYGDVIPNRFQKVPPQPILVQPVQSGFPPGQQMTPYGAHASFPPSQQPRYYEEHEMTNMRFAPQPILSQPMQPVFTTSGFVGQNMPLNVPPGLEYLAQLDRIFIKQQLELLEIVTGCETKNRYKIKDSQGHEMFKAKEDTDCCTRYCCGPIRPFDMTIKDLNDQEVIHLVRPLACQSCCYPCCLQELEVFAPPGQLAGTVEQEWTLCYPQFVVKDAEGNKMLRIEGPLCTCICWDFKIMSLDGTQQVGKISKKWSGLAKELFTDADNFGIEFPMDLDIKMKAVMVGACFLIDFMFYEKSNN